MDKVENAAETDRSHEELTEKILNLFEGQEVTTIGVAISLAAAQFVIELETERTESGVKALKLLLHGISTLGNAGLAKVHTLKSH